MDLKQIERLMAAMGRNGMKYMALKQEGFEIELERECKDSSDGVFYQSAPAPTLRHLPPIEEKVEKAAPETKEGKYITSPMVGTFYSSPSPDDPPYVKVGERVEEGTAVCIIEAMKVMNEVKAGMSGTVAEVLVKNGDPIEFGTKIMRIV